MNKVKICGLSRAEDIKTVNRLLPDYIGFVFAESRRRVDINTAAKLKEKLNPQIVSVGVFVNEDIDIISEIYRAGIVEMVQLHGDEDGEYIKRLKAVCGCPVIKAVGIGDVLPSLAAEPDYFLFDTLSEQRGGTGKTFDWNILNDYRGLPYFLAGGLTTDNVIGTARLPGLFCVDVSSGVETDGIKDAGKIEKFIYLHRRQR